MKIEITEFAKGRHFQVSPFTKVLLSEEDLCNLLSSYELSKEVEKVSIMDTEGFKGTLVRVTKETTLVATLVTRRDGEEPYIQVTSPDNPERLCRVDVILYSKAALAAEGIDINSDYGVVSINGAIDEVEPQAPVSLARNVLGKTGGRKPSVEPSGKDLAESIWYWKDVVLHHSAI